jgi:predicted Rossmann-fold nucleotide-binding protein
MATKKIDSVPRLYIKRKRRVLGELLQGANVKNESSWVSIHRSSKDLLTTFESEGLVVSFNGGGELGEGNPAAKDAATVAKVIAERQGIVISGGKNSGIMQVANETVVGKSVGIIFPELKKEMSSNGQFVIVNSPTPRIELLATCAPFVIIFRGGLGTLMVLMRAIAHLRNHKYHPDQPPQIVFVSNYWIGLLTTMMNMGSLPKEFLSELKFFGQADQIIKQLPVT